LSELRQRVVHSHVFLSSVECMHPNRTKLGSVLTECGRARSNKRRTAEHRRHVQNK
jgi:hypothetical protein